MAAMNTPKIVPPVEVTQDILRKAQNNSIIQALFKNFSKVRPAGTYDVKCHGSGTSVEFFNSEIDARTLARVIRGRKDYSGGDVRLLACSTGRINNEGNCIAQELADRLGAKVSAPNDTLYVNPDGSFYIGRHGNGSMVEFTPRKERR